MPEKTVDFGKDSWRVRHRSVAGVHDVGAHAAVALGRVTVFLGQLHVSLERRIDLREKLGHALAVLEHLLIYYPDGHENEIFIMARKGRADLQEGMDAYAIVARYELYGRHRMGIDLHDIGPALLELDCLKEIVELREGLAYAFIVPFNCIAGQDEEAGYDEGQPAALGEFFRDGQDEDQGAEHEAYRLNGYASQGNFLVLPMEDEMFHHSELGEREGQEDVDGIHDHQGGDRALRVDEKGEGRDADHHDAVAHRQAAGKIGEAAGKPGIDGHVGHDARGVDEARLRADEQEGALG